MGSQSFPFRFDERYQSLLRLIGVTPATAGVDVTTERLVARFGGWRVDTVRANIAGVEVTGPYAAYKVLGPRLSLADRGLTMGTSTDRGVCISFLEPVAGIDPFGAIRHAGLTVTVVDIDGLVAALAQLAPPKI